VALAEMHIPITDGSRLTLTGGLPYYGGPGNSYSMHGIAAMVETLRAHPSEWGLVTANGGWLSEHSVGIYSTQPFRGRWVRANPAPLQAELNRTSLAAGFTVCDNPNGRAELDVFTVEHTAAGPSRLVMIGRLTSGADAGARFAAVNTDRRVIDFMLKTDLNLTGCSGTVTIERNGKRKWPMAVFTPDALMGTTNAATARL
jgi:acetyl-CoA C-acetyltransferase